MLPRLQCSWGAAAPAALFQLPKICLTAQSAAQEKEEASGGRGRCRRTCCQGNPRPAQPSGGEAGCGKLCRRRPHAFQSPGRLAGPWPVYMQGINFACLARLRLIAHAASHPSRSAGAATRRPRGRAGRHRPGPRPRRGGQPCHPRLPRARRECVSPQLQVGGGTPAHCGGAGWGGRRGGPASPRREP